MGGCCGQWELDKKLKEKAKPWRRFFPAAHGHTRRPDVVGRWEWTPASCQAPGMPSAGSLGPRRLSPSLATDTQAWTGSRTRHPETPPRSKPQTGRIRLPGTCFDWSSPLAQGLRTAEQTARASGSIFGKAQDGRALWGSAGNQVRQQVAFVQRSTDGSLHSAEHQDSWTATRKGCRYLTRVPAPPVPSHPTPPPDETLKLPSVPWPDCPQLTPEARAAQQTCPGSKCVWEDPRLTASLLSPVSRHPLLASSLAGHQGPSERLLEVLALLGAL